MTPPLDLAVVAKSAEMRLISLLFSRPSPARGEIAALAAEIPAGPLREAADRLAGLDEPVYVAIFGPGGPVSPREVAYSRLDAGRIVSDVAAFYDAFAYRPKAEDPLDHVAVETGFVAFLHLKEAFAAARGDAEAAGVTAQARDRFTAEHLGPLAGGIVRRLRSIESPDLLALARILLERTGAAEPAEEPPADEGADEISCPGRG